MTNYVFEQGLADLLQFARQLPSSGIVRQIPGISKSSFFFIELSPEWQAAREELVSKVKECFKYDKSIDAHTAKLITKLLAQPAADGEKKSAKKQTVSSSITNPTETRASLEQKFTYYSASAGELGLHISLAEDTKKASVGKIVSFEVVRVYAQAHPLAITDMFQSNKFHSYRFCFEVLISAEPAASSASLSAPSLTISSSSTADVALRSTSHITFACCGIQR